MCRGKTVVIVTAMLLCAVPVCALAQRLVLVRAGAHSSAGPTHSAAQSYLGVGLRDVSEEQMTALRLHEARGAEILMVDHDGPAGKAGLRAHDVVLQMNGQVVEGQEQLRRMLRETPPGRSVALTIWRDGQQQMVTAQLADRDEIEKRSWERHFVVPDPDEAVTESDTVVPTAPLSRGFLGSHIVIGTGYTGVMLDTMEPQLAAFFGVKDGRGLLVKGVDTGSPAADAGLRAGDVVLRVNGNSIASRSEWLRATHDAKGKTATVTLLRDHREMTVTMAVDTKKHSMVEPPRLPVYEGESFPA